MRNWCAALVMSALLALPLCAQQKSSAADDENGAANAAAEKSAPASLSAARTNIAPRRGVFALPAKPRPTPFPEPAAVANDTRPPGTLVPKFEIAATYSYINFAPGDPFANFNSHGGAGSVPYHASKCMGATRRCPGHRGDSK